MPKTHLNGKNMMFNEQKAAQMAAFFAAKENGQIAVLKLVKLLYLSDRESLLRYSFPISGDCPVSMPHGPVLSRTYSLICEGSNTPNGWDAWISDKENHEVRVSHRITRDDLDELSDAELDVMEAVWQQFGGMDRWAIRDYTHDHCTEWQDPKGSSRPIEFADIFRALGRAPAEAQALAAQLQSERAADQFLKAL